MNNGTTFFGFLDWLQQNQVAKILSEPNIVAVSGRPGHSSKTVAKSRFLCRKA